jgi:hypothetical protein
VPEIRDFVAGLKIALKPSGIVTMEFPHLLQLVENNQFDTIYHEHFSYLSMYTVDKIFAAAGLKIFDVEEVPTHGGSLRIFAKHDDDETHSETGSVAKLVEKEETCGLQSIEYYLDFQPRVDRLKDDLLTFLIEQKNYGKKVAAYVAAAKGNTLLNYCGVKKDLVEFVVDASPHKQGRFMPASHIPIVDESRIRDERPDFVLILPWNIKDEITRQLSYISDWRAKFVVAVPSLEVSQ